MVSQTPLSHEDELTRAPRAQNGHAQWVDGRVERCRSWRSTLSGSSQSSCVPPAVSTRAPSSRTRTCASMSSALSFFPVRAGSLALGGTPPLPRPESIPLMHLPRIATGLFDADMRSRGRGRRQDDRRAQSKNESGRASLSPSSSSASPLLPLAAAADPPRRARRPTVPTSSGRSSLCVGAPPSAFSRADASSSPAGHRHGRARQRPVDPRLHQRRAIPLLRSRRLLA